MTTEQKIEQVAEKLYPKNPFWIGSGDSSRLYDEFKSQRDSFISGVKSEASKEYWQKQFEKEKLEFAIEQLNTLYNNLQEKYRVVTSLHKECVGKMREQHLRNKKAGISVGKEEIRRNIKELEQRLLELENEKYN